VHGETDVVGSFLVENAGAGGGGVSAMSCAVSGESGPKTFGMSKPGFSSTMLAVETSPTSHPARVHGTQGAGVATSVVVADAGTLSE
jgi:hypothetical protein